MPVEIREIVIRTEISGTGRDHAGSLKEKELIALKKQLLEECRRIISDHTKQTAYKR